MSRYSYPENLYSTDLVWPCPTYMTEGEFLDFELPEGQEGLLAGKEVVNFEDEFCNSCKELGVELDRDRNNTPISKLIQATVKDLEWDHFTGQ